MSDTPSFVFVSYALFVRLPENLHATGMVQFARIAQGLIRQRQGLHSWERLSTFALETVKYCTSHGELLYFT